MSRRLSGLLVPITTPFDAATGEVEPVSLRQNVRSLLELGVDGIVAAGSTGEAPLLDEGEYRRILSWLRDIVPPDKWLIAGAGRESTRATIAACRVCAEEDGDAVLVRPPAYYGAAMTQTAIVNHFRRVADESPVPVMLYNIPKYTHIALSDSLFGELAEHPNIMGAKDSSGDLKNFAAYCEAVPQWAHLVGSGALYYPALELGASGAIAATACFATAATMDIGAAFAEGDKRRAGADQEVVAPLHREIVSKLGVAGVKTAVDAVGWIGGPVRSPLRDLDEPTRSRVLSRLRVAEVVTS